MKPFFAWQECLFRMWLKYNLSFSIGAKEVECQTDLVSAAT
jgi:hypothetical protein